MNPKDWKRRQVKLAAKHTIRQNYFACILITFFIVLVVTGPVAISQNINDGTDFLTMLSIVFDNGPVHDALEKFIAAEQKVVQATSIGGDSGEGFIGGLMTDSLNAGGFIFALLEGLNKSVLKGNIASQVITGVGIVLELFMIIFFHGLLKIGVKRFYLEARTYARTPFSRLLFIYRIKRIWSAGFIVGLRLLYLVLWGFTLIGFPIKFFQYYLVPYLLAENPDIPPNQIFKLSSRMMKGSKFRTFLFEVSFLGWSFLSLITFGFVGYLFLTPYREAARAELYMRIRRGAIDSKIEGCEYLVDSWLEPAELPEDTTEYPVEKYHIPVPEGRRWMHGDPNVRYPLPNLVLLFFIFSFIGWLWEVALYLVHDGTFVNRGTMYGPWIPIYGCGGVLGLVLLRRFMGNPLLLFFMSIIVCGIVEYGAATFLWEFKHAKYWDYTGYFFNIQGRVCLEGLIIFGLASTASMYIISPVLNNLLEKLSPNTKRTLAGLLAVGFCSDLSYVHFHPHTGKGISSDFS
jgi:hypothetical protein